MFEYRNIIEPFLSNVRQNPGRVACVYEDSRVTYAELDALSARIASAFASRGVRQGDRIAYLLPNRIELIAVYIAIQRIGAVAVPLNFRLIPREIAFLTNSVEARILVFDKEFQGRIVEARGELSPSTGLISVGKSTDFSERLYDLEVERWGEEPSLYLEGGLSRIQFTGGTTGVPKGACRSHAADLTEIHAIMVSNEMLAMEHPVVLIQCPLEHHGGHSWFMSALSSNATIIICGKFDAEGIFAQIDAHRATHMILLPPTTYARLVRDGHAERYDLSSMRIVQSSAGSMTPEIVKAIFSVFPYAEINYGWGQSESGVGTSARIGRDDYSPDDLRLESVGLPMETLEWRIVGADGTDVSGGEAGELLIRSPAIMDGYYLQPELTRNAFVGGWLRTGDIMRADKDGYLYLLSRVKDVIKSGGENVFAGEVQAAILRNPLVADCIVFGVSDDLMGEAVAAVVQPVKGAILTEDDIQNACRTYIASYKKPRYIAFVDDLERDGAGKVRIDEAKKKLRCLKTTDTQEIIQNEEGSL